MASLLFNNLGIICPVCHFLSTAASRQCPCCGKTLWENPPATPLPLAPQRPSPSSVNIHAPALPPPISPAPSQHLPPISPSALLPPAPIPPTHTPPDAALYATTQMEASSAYYPAPTPPYPPPQEKRPASPSQRFSPFSSKPYAALLALTGTYRGQRFALHQSMQIGRLRGQLLFTDDPFVSPLHATLWVHNHQIYVRDESGVSGIYVSIQKQETIAAQQKFCAGIRLFRYLGQLPPTPPYIPGRLVIHGTPVPVDQANYAIEEILVGDRPGRSFVSSGPSLFIGTTKCDLSYSLDEGMAPRHCELILMPQSATLCDFSNGLGTYVRIPGDRLLLPGDRLRIGQQILQLEAPS